jgi:hypothetical protein
MRLRTNIYDLWTFHRQNGSPRYLLYRTSQAKADKWFFGARFWQIPGGFVSDGDDVIDAMLRDMTAINLTPIGIWAVEHTYTYYNTRRKNIEIVPVFAAEVPAPCTVELSWEHSECGWFTAAECLDRIRFRGLRDGLARTREYISESSEDADLLKLL